MERQDTISLDELKSIEGADRSLMRFLRYPSTFDGFRPGEDLGITAEELAAYLLVLADQEFVDNVQVLAVGDTVKILYPNAYAPRDAEPDALCFGEGLTVMFGNLKIKVVIKPSTESIDEVLKVGTLIPRLHL